MSTEFEPLPASTILRVRRAAKLGGLDEVGIAWEILAHQDRAIVAQLCDLLPGSYYMDPPDGGNVSVLEQFRRMAEDAARWRKHISEPLPRAELFSVTPHHLCANLAGCETAPLLCDACMNAAGN